MFCNCCKKELPEIDFFPNRKKGGFYEVCRKCRQKLYSQNETWHKKNIAYKYFEIPTDKLTLEIVNNACKLFGVAVRDIYSDCRMQAMAYARAYICQQLRDKTSLSTLQIGKKVHLAHTCVMRNCKTEMREKVNNFITQRFEDNVEYKKVCNYKTGEIMYVKK